MRIEEIYAKNCIDSIKEWVKTHPEDLYDLYEDVRYSYTILDNLKRGGQGLQHIRGRIGSMQSYIDILVSRGVTNQYSAISNIGEAARADMRLVEAVMAVVDDAHIDLLDPTYASTSCGAYIGTVAVYLGEEGLSEVLKAAGIEKEFNRH